MSERDEVYQVNHAEYQELCRRLRLGGRLTLSVWAGCTLASQESMLDQLRAALARLDCYAASHGEVC